jgi:hypothetical protein
VSRYRFIEAEQATYPVAILCRTLGVSRQSFYAWHARGRSVGERADQQLPEQISTIHRASRGTYGAPRVRAELRDDYGVRASRKRVARLLRAHGLVGCHRRRRRGLTRHDPAAIPPPDLVGRLFDPGTLDRVWYADISSLPTGQGWLYLAAVLDGCARKVVGRAVHRRRLRPSAPDGRPAPEQGPGGDLFRQRRLRELLRDVEDRAGPHPRLADPPGRPHRHLRVHRGLLQPSAPTSGSWLSQPHPVREEPPPAAASYPRCRLAIPCLQNRVNPNEPYRYGRLGGVCQWIESIIDTLKGQLGLEQHGGRTPQGLFVRVVQRLLALAAAIWFNWHLGA